MGLRGEGVKRRTTHACGWAVGIKKFGMLAFEVDQFSQQPVIGGIAKDWIGLNVIRVVGFSNLRSQLNNLGFHVHHKILPGSPVKYG